MQFIVKGTIYRMLYMGFSFCVGLLFAAISGKYIYGNISLMTANVALLVIVTGMGHDASLVWHRSANQLSAPQAFSYALLIGLQQLLLYFLITGVYFSFTGKLFISQQSSAFLGYELLYFLGIIFLDKYAALMYAAGRAVPCNAVLAISTLILLLLLGAGVAKGLWGNSQTLPLFCGYTFLLALILAVYYHGKNPAGPFSLAAGATLRSFFFFSLTVFLTNFVQFLAYRADYWFINYYFSYDQVGVYAQANRFSQLLWVVPNIVAGIIASSMTRDDAGLKASDLQFTVRVMNLLNLLLVPVLLLLAWGGYLWIIPDFAPGWGIIPWMMAGFFFFCNTIILAAYFSARKKLRVNLLVSLICFILIIILDTLWIPGWGIRGAGWANAVAYSLSGFMSLWFYSRETKLSVYRLFWPQAQDWKRLQAMLRVS